MAPLNWKRTLHLVTSGQKEGLPARCLLLTVQSQGCTTCYEEPLAQGTLPSPHAPTCAIKVRLHSGTVPARAWKLGQLKCFLGAKERQWGEEAQGSCGHVTARPGEKGTK